MKIALIQMDIAWNQVEENLQRAQNFGAQAVQQGAELVIFPEMFVCGFSFLQGSEACQASKRAFTWLEQFSSTHKVWACGSAPFSGDGNWEKPFNTLRVYGPTGCLGEYSKLHLFSFGGEREKYRAGDSLLTLNLGGVRISFFICYDLRFPVPFSTLAPETDLFVVVANWPQVRREHWCTLLSARAIENQAYVAAVNRIGNGGGLSYCGDSRIISPTGTKVLDAGNTAGSFTGEMALPEVATIRQSFSVLRDRRMEALPLARK